MNDRHCGDHSQHLPHYWTEHKDDPVRFRVWFCRAMFTPTRTEAPPR